MADMEATFNAGEDPKVYRKQMLADSRIECNPAEASEAAQRLKLQELEDLIMAEGKQWKDLRKQFQEQYKGYLSSTPKEKRQFTSQWVEERRRSTPLPD